MSTAMAAARRVAEPPRIIRTTTALNNSSSGVGSSLLIGTGGATSASSPQALQLPRSISHGLMLLQASPSSGAHRIILTAMYDLPLGGACERLVPQLVHACSSHRCARQEECQLSLRRLLSRIAAHSVSAAVRLIWAVDATGGDAHGSARVLEGLRDMIEVAAVNGGSILPVASPAGSPTAHGPTAQRWAPPSVPVAPAKPASADTAAVLPPAGIVSAVPAASMSPAAATPTAAHAAESRTAAIIAAIRASAAALAAGGTTTDDVAPTLDQAPDPSTDRATLHDAVARKVFRSTVLNDQRLFFQQLVEASDHLRKVADRSARKGQLHALLTQIGRGMERRRVFMPLSEPHERPRWIIRLLPDEGAVFSSRERAPFLVYVETIQAGGGTCAAPDGPDTESLWARVAAAASGGGGTGSSGGAANPGVGRDGIARHRRSTSAGATGIYGPDAAPATVAAQDRVTSVFRESHAARVSRLARASPFSHLPGWGVDALIVKAGDDMRQEELALQAIDTAHRIWRDAGVPAFVLPYRAISVAVGGGVMELVRDSMSLDGLKKAAGVTSLPQLFQRAYGEGTPERAAAQRNFIESMAGYSALCYLLQLKDRHNGNLMLLRTGHLAHIDFGFLLGTSPGGIGFESAPFKLSQELLDTIGGVGSPGFQLFALLLFQAVMAIRARADEFVTPIQILAAVPSPLPCFANEAAAVAAVDGLRSRLALHITDDVQAARHIRGLLDASLNNWRTTRYDQFQTWQNGII